MYTSSVTMAMFMYKKATEKYAARPTREGRRREGGEKLYSCGYVSFSKALLIRHLFACGEGRDVPINLKAASTTNIVLNVKVPAMSAMK